MEDINRQIAGLQIIGIAMLLCVAGVIYWWAFPILKIKLEKLNPMSLKDPKKAEIVEYLIALCHETELKRIPVFVCNPCNYDIDGCAFGHVGQYYVMLTAGLVTKFKTDLPLFRAVMLHELAHLRNGDVDKTYFTMAIWWAFVFVALSPLLILIIRMRPWTYSHFVVASFSLVIRSLSLVLLVYLIRNSVLHAREMYADVRASVWEGHTGTIRRMLSTKKDDQKRGLCKFLQHVHPSREKRSQTLDQTNRLLSFSFRDALFTGIAAIIAFRSLEKLVGLLWFQQVSQAPTVVGFVFAPLAVGVVGLGVWRATFAELIQGQLRLKSGRLGLGLGLGILLGKFLSFEETFRESNTNIANLITNFFYYICWGSLLLVSLFLFLRWLADGAVAWIEVATERRSLRRAYIVGLIVAGSILALWLSQLFLYESLGASLTAVIAPFVMVLINMNHPATLAFLVALWAYPLLPGLWRRRSTQNLQTSWIFLEPCYQPLTLPSLPPYRLNLALKIGLRGGLLFCFLLLLLRIIVSVGFDNAIRSTYAFKLAFYSGQVALAILIQMGVAVFVAGRVKRMRAMHGLFAAFISGCVMTVGLLGLNLLFGGSIDLSFSWMVFTHVINGGALLALPLMLILSIFRRH